MKSAAQFIDANTTCSLSKPTFNLAAKAKEQAYAADSFPVSRCGKEVPMGGIQLTFCCY